MPCPKCGTEWIGDPVKTKVTYRLTVPTFEVKDRSTSWVETTWVGMPGLLRKCRVCMAVWIVLEDAINATVQVR